MRDIFAPSAVHGAAIAGNKARATAVRAQIDKLKTNLGNGRWELAALFSEARSKAYNLEWGYTDFDLYIDESNFDVGSRECRHLIRAHDVAVQLGIDREQLNAVAFSKVKEIFRLDPATQGDSIKQLLSEAAHMSLESVRTAVRALKGGDPETELTWINMQVLRRAKEETILPALAKIKLEYGPTMGDTPGETAEISDGRALEMLCADKLSEPDLELEELQAAADAEEPEEA